MTEDQFNTLLAGATIAHEDELHRLGSLLNAAAAVTVEASEANVANLADWAVKVANDLVQHRRKNPRKE